MCLGGLPELAGESVCHAEETRLSAHDAATHGRPAGAR